MTLQIRNAEESDSPLILSTINEAFGAEEGAEIAALVTALLAASTASPVISLVAEADRRVVGHVLFSSAQIQGAERPVQASILAPLCVVPEYQKSGVGGELVRKGLRAAALAGCDLVFVLGHPEYYPRHGFTPSGIHGLEAPYPIPPQKADAWMVQELRPNLLGAITGQVICAGSLMEQKYWKE